MAADDFEVSIFLTDTSTRHSLLTKHKHFHDTTQTRLTSNSGRLIGASTEAPIDVDVAAELGGRSGADSPLPQVRREDSDDDDPSTTLAAIPAATRGGQSKRPRKNTIEIDDSDEGDGGGDDDDDDEGLFVDSDEDEAGNMAPPPAKRRKEDAGEADHDDKKKLAMDITYEGFSIYGRVLCLVIKRREGGSGTAGAAAGTGGKAKGAGGKGGSGAQAGKSTEASGQAMMETFIMSTQVPAGAEG